MTLSLPWLTTLFFITIRLGTLLLFTPIQAIHQLPIHSRLILIFSISLLISNYLPLHTNTSPDLLLSALAELANGLILATSIYLAFAVFQIAGQLIDNEIGFNATAVFNPGTHTQEALSSHLLSMLAVLFFFSLDGPQWIFQGLIFSFQIIPPGTLHLFSGFKPIMSQVGFMFSMSFMLASPILLALLTIDLCGALITRNMPQISVYFLGLPIKILLGLLLFMMMMELLNPFANTVFQYWLHTWQELMS